MIMGLHLAISHLKLPLLLQNLSLHSMQAPLHGSGHSLFWTLEVRGGISGTHGYTVLIKQPNGTTLTRTNRTQYPFRLLVPGRPVTHCHFPSYYFSIDLPIQKGGVVDWIPGTMGFDSPQQWSCTEPQALGWLTPTHLRNREPGPMSGLWDPLAQTLTGLEKKRMKACPGGSFT